MILRKNSHDFNLKQVKKCAIICQIQCFLRDLADYMNFSDDGDDLRGATKLSLRHRPKRSDLKQFVLITSPADLPV